MNLKILKETPAWQWPEDAARMLFEILSDDRADESDRLLAAELAGDSTVINSELADALLSILRSDDEPTKLRAKAAIALGPVLELEDLDGFEDPDDVPITERTFQRIQERLRKLYLDPDAPKEVRRRTLEASIRSPQHWHQDAIRAAYTSDDEDWKLTAVFAMRWVRGFDDQILEALENKNEDILYEAVSAAGNRGDRRRLVARQSARHFEGNRQIPAAGSHRRRGRHPSAGSPSLVERPHRLRG